MSKATVRAASLEADIDRLQEIQGKIEDAKSRRSKAEGVIESLKSRMESEYGCSSIAELTKKRKALATQVEKLEERFDTSMTELEEAAEWDTM